MAGAVAGVMAMADVEAGMEAGMFLESIEDVPN